ncbi:hypothetical protein MPER_06755, partial [Moniliophthora perniciosa FA553]
VAGGVLIDFRDMNQATYDAQKDSITLQPGIHWAKAVTALAPQGVAPVGGRAAHVGSGFLLGGGISFLSPSRGWGADNYRELDVVLVNGTVVTANANNEHKDLFKALKGGGNRFGIVTRAQSSPNPYSASCSPSRTPTKSINRMSYADIVANTFPTQDEHGSTYIYGSSALSGQDEEAFLNVYNTNLEFTKENLDLLNNTSITLTPIPDSQIQFGRERGGNAIDAPLTGGYAVVQMAQTLRPGQVEVPQSILDAKKNLLDHPPQAFLYSSMSVMRTKTSLLRTVSYDFLKETYKKYDPEGFHVRFTDGPEGL